MEIAPGVIRVLDKFVNCYILISKDDVVLIDAGLPTTPRLVSKALKQVGRPIEDIHQVLITHSDGDHFGGLARIQSLAHVKAFANHIEADAIQQGKSSRALKPKGLVRFFLAVAAPMFKAPPAQIDEYIVEGQIFPLLGGLKALLTPGHTPGHLSFFASNSGILFSGDSINLFKGQPVPSSGANTWDQAKANQSFEQQMALDPQLICGGHCLWRR